MVYRWYNFKTLQKIEIWDIIKKIKSLRCEDLTV